MDSKPRSSSAREEMPAKPTAVKRAKSAAETASLFLDVEEMIRRSKSQPLSLSRYVE